MDPSGTARAGLRRALALWLPLVLAAFAWLGWKWIGSSPRPSPALEPARAAAPAPRAQPRAEPLEVPEGQAGSERSAGSGEPPARATSPDSAARQAYLRAAFPPNQYRGMVLDEELHLPLPNVVLVFEADPSREIHRTRSDERGQFRTPQLAEEPRWLRAEPPEGFLDDGKRIDLQGKRGDILVPLQRDPNTIAGAIRGELLREAGPWTEETLPKPGSVLLDLVPLSGPKWSRRAQITSERDERGVFHVQFEFPGLPRGEYELTLSSLSAWRWQPTSLRIRPPAEGLSFVRYDLDRVSELVFHVTDRASGEAIEAFSVRSLQLTPSQESGVFLHTGPLETAAVPDEMRFQWSLWAEGYRPAFGDESSFVRRGGQRVAEVALERGWATKVLVLKRDPAAQPAARAEVELDGVSQGFTGEDGMLALAAEKQPARLSVKLAGWRMANDPLQDFNGKSAAQRGQVTIVMLEREK